MKQHITIEQLNELSEKDKKRLVEWWQPKEGDIFVCDLTGEYVCNYFSQDRIYHDSEYWESKESSFPLLSIGQMIEFLTPSYVSLLFDETVMDDALCDDLWEAVKEVLGK